MKLLIKKKYFDEIKAGKKNLDFRDSHITFVCEETDEELFKKVVGVELVQRECLPEEYKELPFFKDDTVIVFDLGVFN